MKLDLRRHGMLLVGLGIVLVMSALALLAPSICLERMPSGAMSSPACCMVRVYRCG